MSHGTCVTEFDERECSLVCCSVLQCVVVLRGNVLQCVAV